MQVGHVNFNLVIMQVASFFLYYAADQKIYADAAPVLISMYKLAMTCGYASARVESLFSAMSYVDAPRRQRSTSERECALTHLFFERNLVKEITFEEFCEEWLKKPRS